MLSSDLIIKKDADLRQLQFSSGEVSGLTSDFSPCPRCVRLLSVIIQAKRRPFSNEPNIPLTDPPPHDTPTHAVLETTEEHRPLIKE